MVGSPSGRVSTLSLELSIDSSQSQYTSGNIYRYFERDGLMDFAEKMLMLLKRIRKIGIFRFDELRCERHCPLREFKLENDYDTVDHRVPCLLQEIAS